MQKIAKLLQILAELFLLGVCGFVAHGPDPFQKIGSYFVCTKWSIKNQETSQTWTWKNFGQNFGRKVVWKNFKLTSPPMSATWRQALNRTNRGPFAKQSKTVPSPMPQHSSNFRELFTFAIQMSSTHQKKRTFPPISISTMFSFEKKIGIFLPHVPPSTRAWAWLLGTGLSRKRAAERRNGQRSIGSMMSFNK